MGAVFNFFFVYLFIYLFFFCSRSHRDAIYHVFRNEDGNVPVAKFIAVSNFNI